MLLEVGVVALVLVLLNARDRRRDRAAGAVIGACPATLRESVAVRARASLLGRGAVVTLDLTACEDHHVWSVVRQVTSALPEHTTLVVRTRVGPSPPAAITVHPVGAVYRSRAS